MFCCPHCSGSSTCSVLLTTLNNVGSKTLFNAVFIRPEQVVRFLLCTCYNKVVPARSIQSWCNNIVTACDVNFVTILLQQVCIRVVATSLIFLSSLLQVDRFATSRHQSLALRGTGYKMKYKVDKLKKLVFWKQIINNDDFYFKRPIIKPGHVRLVLIQIFTCHLVQNAN